eukprot:TRINITY_DN3431_c0_g1_i1.p1 TRINITY_DN3431_c0_g1~~TRINITY_DN3431_c0_g1_i1.p1  ORF type:complete len:761 (+),score=152.22 TRINITY_DN3431_c0_g1_i1:97-2379(+)
MAAPADVVISQPPSVKDLVKKVHKAETGIKDVLLHYVTVPRLVAVFVAGILVILGVVFLDPVKFAVDVKLTGVDSAEDCHRECLAVGVPEFTLLECDYDHISFKEEWCIAGTKECFSTQPSGGTSVRHTSCKFTNHPEVWKPYTVIVVLIVCIVLIVEGAAAEVMLLGACCLFAAVDIISSKQAFGGFASSSVLGLGFLFAIASAIEETGVLEDLVGVMLGNPKRYSVALFRMMGPVALLSACLSNTAIVAMMIPIIVSWARRLNVSPGKLMMPLSFAAQLGGSCTLIGSSHCLVAKESVPEAAYDMQFFDLSPVGFLVAITTFFGISMFIPLLKSSNLQATSTSAGAPRQQDQEDPLAEDPSSPTAALKDDEEQMRAVASLVSKHYVVKVVVRQFSSYNGASSSETCQQLSRLDGVIGVTSTDSETLTAGSVLTCTCSAKGVVAVRQVRGLALGNESELRKLGAGRRHRHLYEAVVSSKCEWLGKKPDAELTHEKYGCCPVAVRGKDGLDCVAEACDVVLLEADESLVDSREYMKSFKLVKKVPNSSPPRFGGKRDKQRSMLACALMLVLIASVTAGWTKLSYGGGILVGLLILIKSRSVAQVYHSIKAPVLLVIVGAFGVSSALQETGVAHLIAEAVTDVAGGAGKLGIRVAVYVVAVALSMFINNSATVAIMGTMVSSMAAQQNMHVSSLVWVLVLAAGSCFTTPLGYQTNMMVMQDGGYTFTDFMRYGFPVQAIHMVLTIATVWLVSDLLGFEGFA